MVGEIVACKGGKQTGSQARALQGEQGLMWAGLVSETRQASGMRWEVNACLSV